MIMTLRHTASIEAFDRQMAVNVRGTMLCYKLAAEEMVERKRGGRIIGMYAPDS